MKITLVTLLLLAVAAPAQARRNISAFEDDHTTIAQLDRARALRSIYCLTEFNRAAIRAKMLMWTPSARGCW